MPIKEEKELYLQILASCLNGKCMENFIIFNGSGGNGKSSLTKLMKIVLGDYYYKLEKGFIEALHFILPFIVKIQELSKLPLNLDIIISHLFNLYRGIPEKAVIIKEKFKYLKFYIFKILNIYLIYYE